METEVMSPYKNAVRYGTYLGLACIILSVLFYLLGMETSKTQQYLQYVIMITMIVIGTRNYRDSELGGYISYGSALWTGVLIAFFSSILIAFYTYLFIKFVDVDFLAKMIDLEEQKMIQSGMKDEEIEMSMKIMSKMMQPGIFTIMIVFVLTFLGFIFSLITSAFLKKENKSFGSNFQ